MVAAETILYNDRFVEYLVNFHKYFDYEVWRGKYSFHNEHHIKSVLKASEILISAVSYGNDPLLLKEDLEMWNRSERTNIPLQSLPNIFRVAFSIHDTGNIIDHIDNGGKPVYMSGYGSFKAEQRSIDIFRELAPKFFVDRDDFKPHSKLIEHLIKESTFDITAREIPFATAVRVIDQIGGSFFGQSQKLNNLGVLAEIVRESPNKTIKPFEFVNFVNLRFPILVPDTDVRNRLLDIWSGKLPEIDRTFNLKEMSAWKLYNKLAKKF